MASEKDDVEIELTQDQEQYEASPSEAQDAEKNEENSTERTRVKRTQRRDSVLSIDGEWLEDFEEKLEDSTTEDLLDCLQHANGKELAAALQDRMSSVQRMALFRAVRTSWERVRYFPYLRSSEVALIFRDLHMDQIQEIMESLNGAYRFELLQELPQETTNKIVSLLSEEELTAIRYYDNYPKDSIGRAMKPVGSVPVLKKGTTLGEAFSVFSKGEWDISSKFALIPIVDEDGMFLGALRLQRVFEIAFESEDVQSTLVDDVMGSVELSISPEEDAEEVLTKMKNRKVQAAPVIDGQGVLVGVVNSQTLFSLYEKQALHRFEMFSSVEPLEGSFSKTTVMHLVRKRVFWLLLLLVINVGTAFIIGAFEEELAANIVLASFMPLIAGLGGNTGSQSAAIMIHSLAAKDLAITDYFHALKKELIVGTFIAIVLAAAGWLLGFIRGDIDIGFVLGLSLLFIVCISNFIGFSLPFIAGILKVDAAAVSGPMVTTVIDMIGVSLYFAFAMAILESTEDDV
eukprot:gb/GECG01010508.1/.p1 GENE.gb/GECG01010508.1/~~gb/GECG01010508.1/.p1  ORF type:complete len:516 (+),score=91.58 gb/GECG01010508.1/:1-1548(+)